MGMSKCTSSRYRNFFLTVPDRGFTKDELVAFIKLWVEKATSRCTFFEVVREPYKNPEKGFTHHYHAGLCFENKVGFLKFRKACNDSKLYTGMDFRSPLVAKGKSARKIFDLYFRFPSKYKRLDEHPMLVIDRPEEPQPTFYHTSTCPPDQIAEFMRWRTWHTLYGDAPTRFETSRRWGTPWSPNN